MNYENIDTIWELRLYKVGSIVMLQINLSFTELNYTKIIGTLPEDIRPSYSVSFNTVLNDGTNCYLFIDTDGKFGVTKIGAAFIENDAIRFCASYVI